MDETDGYLSTAAILSAKDVAEEDVVIPEWGGGKVRITAMTKEQQGYIREQARVRAAADHGCKLEEVNDDQMRTWVERLIFTTCVINPKFSEEQIPQLVRKSAAPIERILLRINRLSGVNEVAQNATEAVKAASKSDS